MRNPILVVAEKWRGWSTVQRGLVVVMVVGVCAMVVGNRPMRMASHEHTAVSAYPPVDYETRNPAAPGAEPGALIDENDLKQLQASAATTREELKKDSDGHRDQLGTPGSPLIAHTAELSVSTKEFTKSRTSLEEILERHRGYAAKLRMLGQKSGSVLSATLRVPSTELGGRERAEGTGRRGTGRAGGGRDTQQRADLEARMTNAQNTLRRLQELLKKQTYPDGNVRELQRQIGNASAEVARLEAERQASEHRVIFANVFFTLREEIAKPSESLGAQLRSAAAAGFGDAIASVAGLLAFLIGRGPVVVLWCAILYVPARLVWKKWAPVTPQPSAVQGD